MIWVINTNSNNCRIYHYDKKPAKVTLVKELTHPESRLKSSEDLTSDRPGHYQTAAHAHGAYSPHTDPKEVEIEKFAREVAKTIDMGRKNQAFQKLIIIAPPHVNGLIFQHVDKNTQELVINNIQKDLQHYTDKDLLDFLQTHAKYAD